MSNYVPDHWQIVYLASPEMAPVYKVFTTWSGGYVWGDEWRLNSGIEKIEDKGDSYDVHGASGSVYKLRKGREGMSGYGQGVLTRLRGQIEASGGIMELMDISEVQEFLEKQQCGETSEQLCCDNTTAKDEEKA